MLTVLSPLATKAIKIDAEPHLYNVISMDLVTILRRCWCLMYVLAVIFQSRAVDAAVSRSQIRIRSGLRPSGNLDTQNDEDCEQLEAEELGQMLGGAYNARYMSIQEPQAKHLDPNSKKRGAEEGEMLFAVDESFAQDLSDRPAWEVNFADAEHSQHPERAKRSLNQDHQKEKRPWQCDMEEIWSHLGPDYFPQYLRTVRCANTRCFNGRFTCQPRSFTVHLLRRRRGRCAQMGRGRQGETNNNSTAPVTRPIRKGPTELAIGLREMWVWEERAVTFCCDCAAASRGYRTYANQLL